MFDKFAEQFQNAFNPEQFQNAFKPVNALVAVNAKALEQLAQQQTALFTGLLNDGVAYTEGLSAQKDVAGIVEAQKAYAEGSISFLYHSPFGRTYLFTGDTFFQSNGQWQTLAFPNAGGSSKALIESLLLYRDLGPDVVLWSASGGGDASFIETNADQWKEDIDSMIKKLRASNE